VRVPAHTGTYTGSHTGANASACANPSNLPHQGFHLMGRLGRVMYRPLLCRKGVLPIKLQGWRALCVEVF
jgi:hypothetical protein